MSALLPIATVNRLSQPLLRTVQLRELLQPEKEEAAKDTLSESWEYISSSPFFRLDDIEAISILGYAFEPELEYLKSCSPTIEASSRICLGALGPYKLSPSLLLYDKDFPEVNRTLLSILVLKWLVSGDYKRFASRQQADTQLTVESFNALRNLLLKSHPSSEDLYALFVAIIINDLGKNPAMWEELRSNMLSPRSEPNHDEVVYLAAQRGMIPLISDFKDSSYPKSLLQGLHLGSRLNIAQLLQGENVPGSLSAVYCLQSNRQALMLKLLEVLFDIAGSQGHNDTRYCIAITEPFYQTYMGAYEALLSLLDEELNLRQAYDTVLQRKAILLSTVGYRMLSTAPEERALLRLLCMARVASRARAQLLDAAFLSLSREARLPLIRGLSIDGINDGPSVIPYYAPALFAVTLSWGDQVSSSKVTTALSALMRFLGKIYESCPLENHHRGCIIECDLRFAQDLIKSKRFLDSPNILDDLDIPLSAYGEVIYTKNIAID
jgi:hypothetical protein